MLAPKEMEPYHLSKFAKSRISRIKRWRANKRPGIISQTDPLAIVKKTIFRWKLFGDLRNNFKKRE